MKFSTWRTITRIMILLLLLAPAFGVTVITGNFNSATWWGVTLTSPLAFLEVAVNSFNLIFPEGLIVLGVYLLLGKAYCGWVCPISLILEIIDKLKDWLYQKPSSRIRKQSYWILPVILVIDLIIKLPLFQMIAPSRILISTFLFGISWELLLLILIVGMQLISSGLWCRILCPLGAFYALIGRFSPLRIKSCESNCQSCINSCTEVEKSFNDLVNSDKVILDDPLCTKCGKCIDNCQSNDLSFTFDWSISCQNSPENLVNDQLKFKKKISRKKLLILGGRAAIVGIVAFPIIRIKETTSPLLRPPGAVKEIDFLAKCIRCGKCIEVCPESTLLMANVDAGAAMGTPYFIPREVPCYLCEDFKCTKVCPSRALLSIDDIEEVKMGVAKIDTEHCFAYNDAICRSCYSACPLLDEAIYINENFEPVINEDKCVGCGICEYNCLMEESAIRIEPSIESRE